MQISQEELLAEAGQLALTVRLLERRNAVLQQENDRLRQQLAAASAPVVTGDFAPVEDDGAAA